MIVYLLIIDFLQTFLNFIDFNFETGSQKKPTTLSEFLCRIGQQGCRLFQFSANDARALRLSCPLPWRNQIVVFLSFPKTQLSSAFSTPKGATPKQVKERAAVWFSPTEKNGIIFPRNFHAISTHFFPPSQKGLKIFLLGSVWNSDDPAADE